jgi:hypothetical protein
VLAADFHGTWRPAELKEDLGLARFGRRTKAAIHALIACGVRPDHPRSARNGGLGEQYGG